jgi:hypothetical protein
MSEIKRRLKRFYRKYEGNEIVYCNKPIKESDTNIKGNNNNNNIYNNSTINDTTITNNNNEDNFKNKIDSSDKIIKEDPEKKKEIIDKILNEMEGSINPDIDAISEMIYNQLIRNNVDIDQNIVQDVVRKTNHYRYRNIDDNNNNNNSQNTLQNRSLNRSDERKRLSEVIDNIYEQIKKKEIKDDILAKKKDQEKKKDKDILDTKDKKTKEEESKDNTKKETIKNKKSEKKESTKEKDDFKLNFGDDDSNIDNNEDLEDEDDLGLKF